MTVQRDRLARHPGTVVWALLIVATSVSWLLGANHQILVNSTQLATVSVLVIAFAKVHLVGMHFMELRHAPRPLALLFDFWVLAVCGIVIGLYLQT